jgi:hypothetical protein
MIRSLIIFVLLTVLSLQGCKKTSESVPPGAYAFTSNDSTGVLIVKGWMTLVIADSSTITGEWHFDAVHSAEGIGPQTGNGNLVGGINGTKVWIELNPNIRNDNLQLNGILSHDRLDGVWSWINYNGVANQGTFSAIKQ